MVYCESCKAEVDLEYTDAGALSCCPQCGRVFEDMAFSNDLTFAKGADGEGEMVGQFVSETGQVRGLSRMGGNRLWGAKTDSFQVALNKGRAEIQQMVDHFHIKPRDDTLEAAQRLYHLAVQRGFTKGRRVQQVAAACLYVVCRLDGQPFMLIDFSDLLQLNVYTLGATYLELIKLLRLEEHPTFTKPIDPSLYIHRFADRLKLGPKRHPVANTTLRLIGSMKRDWMQTGRRPGGVCGAALFIATHIHGVERSKQDIMAVVHIGWSTLDKRVREFTSTGASTLTIDEFEEQAKQQEDQVHQLLEEKGREGEADAAGRDAYCEHIPHGEPHFAHGMCRSCFVDYLSVSGGTFHGQHDPPAYLQGLKRALKKGGGEVLALPAPDADGDALALVPVDVEAAQELAEMDEALADTQLQPLTQAMQGNGGEKAGSSRRQVRTVASLRAAKAGKLAADAAAGDSPEAGSAPGADAAAVPPTSTGTAAGAWGARRGRRALSLLPDKPQPAKEAAGAAAAEAAEAAADALARPAKRVRFAEQVDIAPAAAAAAAGPGGSDSPEGEQQQQQQQQQQQHAGPAAKAAAAAAGSSGTDTAASSEAGAMVLYDPIAADDALAGAEFEDTLSDIDSDDLDVYVASKDEAEVKEAVWLQMNKDWVEKQAAKEAALAQVAQGEAGRTHKKPGPKKGSRRKQELPQADSAQQAVGQLMEAKKLSDKINYSVLEDLFADEGGGGDAPAAGALARRAAPAEIEEQRQQQQQQLPSAVAAELQRRSSQRALEQAAASSKYSRALEEEMGRKAGRGGLGGGFLGALSFMRTEGSGAGGGGGRSRPAGLSARPRK